MSIPVELPALGESVAEGTVARWLVQPGDRVEVDQPLVEVTTGKVDAEIPSPAAGVIEIILAAEGQVVEVGGRLAEIDPGIGSPAVAAASPDRATPLATPLARRMAEEASVELDSIVGSGSGGRITKDDVVRHRRAAATAAPASPAAGRHAFESHRVQPGDRVIPMSPMRRSIAEQMAYSKHTSPHAGAVGEIDMSGVVQLRQSSQRSFEESHGFELSLLPFVVHAVVRALREFPALNACVAGDSIVERKEINIGLALDTEEGPVVPVVHNADRRSLSGLAAAVDDLGSRARSQRLSSDELEGGSFTLSNPGRQGNLYGFDIIHPPQVGIVRMGEVVKRPVVRTLEGEDAIVIRSMMHLALSYDPRAVDGAAANGFLDRVRQLLEAADFDL